MPRTGATWRDAGPDTWSHQVRFVGAGTIAVAAMWTLTKLVKPVVARPALGDGRLARAQGRASGALCRAPNTTSRSAWSASSRSLCLAADRLAAGALRHRQRARRAHRAAASPAACIYIALMGFLVSAVCGYMAGLIGSSNSPLSGIGILVVITTALFLVVAVNPAAAGVRQGAGGVCAVRHRHGVHRGDHRQQQPAGPQDRPAGGCDALEAAGALVIGVIAGAAIIPPILDLLNNAYGFVGAPGAASRSCLARSPGRTDLGAGSGVIQNNVDWSLIESGADRRRRDHRRRTCCATTKSAHLPPLAVGLGIYLPTRAP